MIGHKAMSLDDMPTPVRKFVLAVNEGDLEAILALFAPAALVNDQLCDHWGRDEIRSWAENDVLGERLRIVVESGIIHYNHFTLTAQVDGTFDKRGLPDPLILMFYFSITSAEITELIILRTTQNA